MKPKAGINEVEELLTNLTINNSSIMDLENMLNQFEFTKSTLEIGMYNLSKNEYYKNDFEKLTRAKMLFLDELIKMNNSILYRL